MNRFTIITIFLSTLLLIGCGKLSPEKADLYLSTISLQSVSKDVDQLEEVIKKVGIEKTMAKLVEESKGGSSFDCHQEAHNIGRIGYKIYKEEAFGECDPSCHSGCYHGAMESFLNQKGTTNLAENIEEVCSLFDTGFGRFECLHGVGHGVLAYTDYDMPEGLEQCKSLKDPFSQTSCYGGLFMENILTGQGLGASTEDHETKWVNDTDPHYPCNAISKDTEIQYQCYQMQTSWMLYIMDYDFDKVAKECLKAPKELIGVCYKSFGRDAAGHTLRDVNKIVDICSKVPREENYMQECVTGSVNVIIDFWGPKLQGQATELCKLYKDEDKQTCYNVLAARLQDLFKNDSERQNVCSTFEEKYKNLCENFVEVPIASPVPSTNEPNDDDDTEVLSGKVTIVMKDGIFEPKKITVKKGTTVEFINEGKEDHWPASNIHPTHAIYPEFDPKEGIKPGKSWSKVFDKKGSWRFHDHLFPQMTGVIEVVD